MEKPTKSWGSLSAATGNAFFVQKPTEDELAEHKVKFGRSLGTETYDIGAEEARAMADEWDPQPVIGGSGGTMTFSQNASPLGTLTVSRFLIINAPVGNETEDDVDYGSDGEGGVDSEVWSTAKNRKTTRNSYRIEKDDVTHWPPFMEYGTQLMGPEQVAAYKLLIDGHKPGDVFSFGGSPKQLKDTGAGYDDNYFLLLKGEVLIFKEIWETSWVISNKAHASKYDPGDPEKGEQLPDGWYMSTICRENGGGKDRQPQEPKSWTVTRTMVHTELYVGQTVPEGAELYDVRTSAPESDSNT